MKLTSKLLTISLLLISDAFAIEEAPSEAKIVMDRVHESFIKIIPYVYSESLLSGLKEKKNEAEKEEVIHTLNNISNFFKSAKHVETFQRPGFKPGLDTINNLMTETVQSVRNNSTAYAAKRLRSMTAICLSCHSQLKQDEFATGIPKASQSMFSRPIDYANYLTLMRKFPEAVKQYELALEQNLKNGAGKQSPEEITQAFKRILAIYTKMEFKPEAALEIIKKYKNHTQLPAILKETLAQWESSLEKWKSFNPKKQKSIASFMHKYLEPIRDEKAETAMGKNDVTLLVASGVLSQYLNDKPQSKLAPQILFWLGVADKQLGSTYLFSLGDLYLKECIQQYPKSTFAKKCYREYEDNLIFGYSGSSGTDIPEDEKKELARLKALIK